MLKAFQTFLSVSFFSILLSTFASAQVIDPSKQPGAKIQANNYYPQVKFETNKGELILELNRRKAPLTVNNFLAYVDSKEYDNTIFHRLSNDYVLGGGGYTPDFLPKEAGEAIMNESGNGLENEWYSIAMARLNDPHSATRQFFINLNDNDNLNPGRDWGYAVFGRVISGTEILDEISSMETEYRPLIRFHDVPKSPIILIKAEVLPEP